MTAQAKATDICNMALAKLGQQLIADIYHDRPEAKWCRIHLPLVRQKLLRNHAWNFATRFEELPINEEELKVKWAYRYKLPCDYMQLLRAWHDDERCHRIDEFNVAGRSFLCEEQGAYIEYVADITDPNCWDASFTECVVTALAAELAIPVANSPRDKQALLQELHNLCLPQAHLNNAWEDGSGENNPLEQRLRESVYIQQNNQII